MRKVNAVAISTCLVFLVTAGLSGTGHASVIYECINTTTRAVRLVCGPGLCTPQEIARSTNKPCTSPPPAQPIPLLHGTVYGDGTIARGTGFTVSVQTTGMYVIFFTVAYPSIPDCQVQAVNSIYSVGPDQFIPEVCVADVIFNDSLVAKCFAPVAGTDATGAPYLQYYELTSNIGGFTFTCIP